MSTVELRVVLENVPSDKIKKLLKDFEKRKKKKNRILTIKYAKTMPLNNKSDALRANLIINFT